MTRGGGAMRGRCNNQPEHKRGAARCWRDKRQRYWCGAATTNQRTIVTRGKRQEAAAQQEPEDERSAVRGGGAMRGRCNNQPDNKRGTARCWCNKRQRRWRGGASTNQMMRGTFNKQQEAAARQEA
jgi:hypothetical protein